jgi:hypothetical protein
VPAIILIPMVVVLRVVSNPLPATRIRVDAG